MKRRTRSLVLLAATAALLGAAVFAQLRHERAQALDPLTDLDLAAVRTLAVDCRGCTPRRYEKVDGHWRMTAPRVQPADAARIDRLLAIAHAPVRFRHVRSEIDPAKVGLDPPQATLQLDATTLAFGATDAIHGDRYVAVGTTIALVPDRFSAVLFAEEPGLGIGD
jgi:hypothetical protein